MTPKTESSTDEEQSTLSGASAWRCPACGRLLATQEKQVALRRVVEVGMRNAAAGLSQMVGQEVSIASAPMVRFTSIWEIPMLLGQPDAIIVGIYLTVFGDIAGHITILFSQEQALHLADMLLGVPEGTTQELGDMEMSALGEMGNITGSFFLNALADKTDLVIQPSPPTVMVDMCGAILDIAVSDICHEANETLLFEAEFLMNGRRASGYFLTMPNPSGLESILAKVTS